MRLAICGVVRFMSSRFHPCHHCACPVLVAAPTCIKLCDGWNPGTGWKRSSCWDSASTTDRGYSLTAKYCKATTGAVIVRTSYRAPICQRCEMQGGRMAQVSVRQVLCATRRATLPCLHCHTTVWIFDRTLQIGLATCHGTPPRRGSVNLQIELSQARRSASDRM